MKGCSFRNFFHNFYFQELWTAEFQENNALLLGKEDEAACGVAGCYGWVCGDRCESQTFGSSEAKTDDLIQPSLKK